MEIKKALKLRKAKYIKRTGSPGKYKYQYKPKKGTRQREGDFISKEGKHYAGTMAEHKREEEGRKESLTRSIVAKMGLASSKQFEQILKDSSPDDHKKVKKLLRMGFDPYQIEGTVSEGGLDDGGIDWMIENPEEAKAEWNEAGE